MFESVKVKDLGFKLSGFRVICRDAEVLAALAKHEPCSQSQGSKNIAPRVGALLNLQSHESKRLKPNVMLSGLGQGRHIVNGGLLKFGTCSNQGTWLMGLNLGFRIYSA